MLLPGITRIGAVWVLDLPDYIELEAAAGMPLSLSLDLSDNGPVFWFALHGEATLDVTDGNRGEPGEATLVFRTEPADAVLRYMTRTVQVGGVVELASGRVLLLGSKERPVEWSYRDTVRNPGGQNEWEWTCRYRFPGPLPEA